MKSLVEHVVERFSSSFVEVSQQAALDGIKLKHEQNVDLLENRDRDFGESGGGGGGRGGGGGFGGGGAGDGIGGRLVVSQSRAYVPDVLETFLCQQKVGYLVVVVVVMAKPYFIYVRVIR